MIKIQRLIALCIVAFAAFSCTYEPYVAPEVEIPTDTVSFSETIEPIFDAQGCVSCHPPTKGIDLTAGNAYASIVPDLVDLESPDNSTIYTIAEPSASHPKNYTSEQSGQILAWITQGALNN